MRQSLWTYSCQLYQYAPVQELLLQLQDAHGLNVNMMLALLYLADHQESLTEKQISEYIQRTEVIADKINALRAVRKLFKDDDEDAPFQETYQHLKQAELAAEKVHLHVLERLFELLPPVAEEGDDKQLFQQNLVAYWNVLNSGGEFSKIPTELKQLIVDAPLFSKACR